MHVAIHSHEMILIIRYDRNPNVAHEGSINPFNGAMGSPNDETKHYKLAVSAVIVQPPFVLSSQPITLMYSVYKTIPNIHQLRHKTPEKPESRRMIALGAGSIALFMIDFNTGESLGILIEVAINQAQGTQSHGKMYLGYHFYEFPMRCSYKQTMIFVWCV